MASSAPVTPPAVTDGPDLFHTVNYDDLTVLEQVSSPEFNPAKFRRRDAHFDPLIFAAAACVGTEEVTRHHYLHYDVCAKHGRLNCTETADNCSSHDVTGDAKKDQKATEPPVDETSQSVEVQVKVEGPVSPVPTFPIVELGR